MTNYSLKKNLIYAWLLFTQPRKFSHLFGSEKSSLYGFIPFAVYLILGEIGIFLAAFSGRPVSESVNPFPTFLAIPHLPEYTGKAILYPILNIISLGVFALIFYLLSRLSFLKRANLSQAIKYLLFLSILGLPALLVEMLPNPGLLIIIVPLSGLAALIYMIRFIHDLFSLSWKSSQFLSVCSLGGYYIFRGLIMR